MSEPPPRYRLVLRDAEGNVSTADFTSYTGHVYDIGDTIAPEGETSWRVVQVTSDEEGRPSLVCEPAEGLG